MTEPSPEFPSSPELAELISKLVDKPSQAREATALVVAKALLSRDTAGLARLSLAFDKPAIPGSVNGWVEAASFKSIVDCSLEILDASEPTKQ